MSPPLAGRVFRSRRRIRLADRDAAGRLRLDAIARYLQDVATDDVDETGWGAPEHLWVVRHMRIDVVAPPIEDDRVELVTWCSGKAVLAAGRRMTLVGDRGGRVEADSVWVHLGPDAKPARIRGFGAYAEAAGERVVSTRLVLPEPRSDGWRRHWPLRFADLDVMGHVNNAAFWQAVEQCLLDADVSARSALRARLDYRHPIDLGEDVELTVDTNDEGLSIGFWTNRLVKAVALVEQLG